MVPAAGKLCEAISLSRLQFRGVKLELLERKFEIDSEQCWRLGMIVSELVRFACGSGDRLRHHPGFVALSQAVG
jgi:two-component sensor histidine kinase